MKLNHKLKEQIELLAKKIESCLETSGGVSDEYAKTVNNLAMAQLAIYQAAHMLPHCISGIEVGNLPETEPTVDFRAIKKTWNTGNEN